MIQIVKSVQLTLSVFACVSAAAYGDDLRAVQDARVRQAEAEIAICKERCQVVDELFQLGYAAPMEKQFTDLQRMRLELHRDHLLATNTEPTEADISENEGSNDLLFVVLPGMNSPGLQELSRLIVQVNARTAVNIDDDQMTTSVEPQRTYTHALLSFRRRLLKRLRRIDDGSEALANEIRFHERKAEALEAQLEALQGQQIIGHISRPSYVTTSKRHDSMKLALAAYDNEVERQRRLLVVAQESATSHRQHLEALRDLPQDAVTNREIERQELLIRIAEADESHHEVSWKRMDIQRQLLSAFANESANNEVLVSLQDDATSSSRVSIQERIAALMQHVEKDTTAINRAKARQALAQWRLVGLEDLEKEGHATWLEVEKARLGVARWQSEAAAAIDRQRVARNAQRFLSPENDTINLSQR